MSWQTTADFCRQNAGVIIVAAIFSGLLGIKQLFDLEVVQAGSRIDRETVDSHYVRRDDVEAYRQRISALEDELRASVERSLYEELTADQRRAELELKSVREQLATSQSELSDARSRAAAAVDRVAELEREVHRLEVAASSPADVAGARRSTSGDAAALVRTPASAGASEQDQPKDQSASDVREPLAGAAPTLTISDLEFRVIYGGRASGNRTAAELLGAKLRAEGAAFVEVVSWDRDFKNKPTLEYLDDERIAEIDPRRTKRAYFPPEADHLRPQLQALLEGCQLIERGRESKQAQNTPAARLAKRVDIIGSWR